MPGLIEKLREVEAVRGWAVSGQRRKRSADLGDTLEGDEVAKEVPDVL
jgi:hypothetical protein